MITTERGKHSLQEIHNQPNAWKQALETVEAKAASFQALADDIDEWIFTGCGSAYNVCQTAVPTFQQFTDFPARAVPAADVVYFPDTVLSLTRRPLVVLISRSGETSETVEAGQVAKARGARTLSITCYPDSPLAELSDETIVLSGSQEKSVITTESLTAMVLCVQALSGVIGDAPDYLAELKQLPSIGVRVLEQTEDLGRQLGHDENLTRFAFVGNGPYFGLTKECQLKVKETVLLPSDSYPLFDFRHGPKSNVDEHMLVTVLLSDAARDAEITFVEDMKALHGQLCVLCDRANERLREAADYVVEVESGLSDHARGILYLPLVHFLSYYRSLARGFDPDNPVNLTYWVEL
jgi:glucosamine--fructose-6-phosphate aminotransferase (isomerizing)